MPPNWIAISSNTNNSIIESFFQSLRNASYLKLLNLGNCGLEQETARELFQSLSNIQLEKLVVSIHFWMGVLQVIDKAMSKNAYIECIKIIPNDVLGLPSGVQAPPKTWNILELHDRLVSKSNSYCVRNIKIREAKEQIQVYRVQEQNENPMTYDNWLECLSVPSKERFNHQGSEWTNKNTTGAYNF